MAARQALLLAVRCIGCQRPCLMHMASPSCPASSWLCFAVTGSNHSLTPLRCPRNLKATAACPPLLTACCTWHPPFNLHHRRPCRDGDIPAFTPPVARLLRMCPPLPGDQVVAQVLSSSGEVLSHGQWTAVSEAAQA